MDPKLTEQIQQWLETPKEQRNVAAGAMMLLKINRNQVLYRNIIAKPMMLHDKLEYELKKHLQWRLEKVTHEQVAQMEARAETIARKNFTDENNPAKDFRAGKREDHDSLPEEIQALYVENKSVLQKMRDLHAQLRIIQAGRPGYTCKDSDKFPFLKELIRLDKLYHDNWAKYDGFNVETAEVMEQVDARQASRKATAFVNFNKGKYRANPTPELKEKLANAYALISSPSEKLTSELVELGIITNP